MALYAEYGDELLVLMEGMLTSPTLRITGVLTLIKGATVGDLVTLRTTFRSTSQKTKQLNLTVEDMHPEEFSQLLQLFEDLLPEDFRCTVLPEMYLANSGIQ